MLAFNIVKVTQAEKLSNKLSLSVKLQSSKFLINPLSLINKDKKKEVKTAVKK